MSNLKLAPFLHCIMIPFILLLLTLLSPVMGATLDGGYSFSTGSILTGILCIVLGFVLLFYGYRILKTVLFITGFYVFCKCIHSSSLAIIGYALLTQFEPTGGYDNRDLVLIFGSLAIGIVGGLLSYFIFRLGLFMMGALAGLLLALFLLSLKNGGLIPDPTGRIVFLVFMALLGGIVIQFFVKPLVIIFTSFDGAYSIVYGIDIFAQTGFNEIARDYLSGKATSVSTYRYVFMS